MPFIIMEEEETYGPIASTVNGDGWGYRVEISDAEAKRLRRLQRAVQQCAQFEAELWSRRTIEQYGYFVGGEEVLHEDT